ncbi:hypothetical protein Rmet_5863 (plasmid) [Cupriavidus metallidurans CH34]|uniref:Uncharacterized protein n=1 Tax=Cupriavidus metallidurans (strain ATCC 43123 / DSM 2839 / NBRC 102507 / CH34) TaxID=266264 RepID=Q1LAV4_CUPMC|nr:hypothetical protein Rmet_5863 [Cupriavidus metallidurans CH34]
MVSPFVMDECGEDVNTGAPVLAPALARLWLCLWLWHLGAIDDRHGIRAIDAAVGTGELRHGKRAQTFKRLQDQHDEHDRHDVLPRDYGELIGANFMPPGQRHPRPAFDASWGNPGTGRRHGHALRTMSGHPPIPAQPAKAYPFLRPTWGTSPAMTGVLRYRNRAPRIGKSLHDSFPM